MANAHEMHTVVDSSRLPEQLRDYQALGLDENNRLVGKDTEGNIHSIRNVSRIALAGFHEAGGIGSVSMEGQLQELAEAVNSLRGELEAERTNRAQERADLLSQIEGLQARLDANDPLKRNFEINSNVQVSTGEGEEAELQSDWKVISGVWLQEEGGEEVQYVTVMKDGEAKSVKLSDLRQWQAEGVPASPPDPTNPPTDPPRQGWLRRSRDRATIATGNILTGSRSTEVRETDRRGRLGVFAVGVVIGAVALRLLEHKYFGHSPSREARYHAQEMAAHKAEMNGIAANAHAIAANKVQEAADHAQDMANHTAEMKGIAANAHAIADNSAQEAADKAQILARINEVHNSDLRAMHGILKQVHEIKVHEHIENLGGHGGHASSIIDTNHAQANTITAHNQIGFQKNVAQLLRDQGLHVSGDTPHRLARMSNWMRGQKIASGVNSDHSQHLVKFSAAAFKNPSHQTGFKIGADGSGARALHGWINHAKSIGIKISA